MNKYIKYLKDGSFLSRLWNRIFQVVGLYKLYNLFSLFDKVDNNKIVISNYFGSGYGDNGKYIVQYIFENKLPFKIVWLVDKKKCKSIDSFPSLVKIVDYYSFSALKELSTSKYWIDNCRKFFSPPKKKNQIYIQTWHGTFAIKKIEKDAVNLPKYYIDNAIKDSTMIDFLLSGSNYSSKIYESCFWYDGTICNIGTPRNDIFFNEDKVNKANLLVHNNYKIDKETNICLYAPTFRQNESFSPYSLNYLKVQSCLENKFGGNWKICVRLHPNLNKISDSIILPESVINVSDYNDMQELLCASSIVISDYSGLVFDYINLKRPVFLFCTDLRNYLLHDREMYLQPNELPFAISESNEELLELINKFDKETYLNTLVEFSQKYSFCEKGEACKTLFFTIINC